MILTSITFALFLFLIFLLYWFVFEKNLGLQNLFLLVASYLFYGWWDWRFLFLLFFISACNYFIGLGLGEKRFNKFRKLLLISGLSINIGTLIFFKYFNFFIEGFINFLLIFGYKANSLSLSIILPLGISFYIFLSISYLIDVYQLKIPAVKNFFNVLLTFSFFPIIIAGPIHRPASLLPQIQRKRTFDYFIAVDGLKQILWGAFTKIVIADCCAVTVDTIFSDFTIYSSSTLILGILLFTVQIYADFSGYSNIAAGIGKLLGFNIMQNFAFPYFSLNFREFWRKWNISLTNWFRDYVFLPLAYSLTRKIKIKKFLFFKSDLLIYIICILVTWFLSGLWHGANYTFVAWGVIHGIFLIVNHVKEKPRRRLLKRIGIKSDNKFIILSNHTLTVVLIMFTWIFFRADSIGNALSYIVKIFSFSFFSVPQLIPKATIIFVIIFFILEWIGKNYEYALAGVTMKIPVVVRWIIYYCIILSLFYFSGSSQQFIYSQF
jgi:alginate O-acetyltransferase complex protein AlgI